MLQTLIRFLYDQLRDRSRSKTETNVEVNVEQKITVVTINIDRQQ